MVIAESEGHSWVLCQSRLVTLVSSEFQVEQEEEAGLAESRQGGRKVFRLAAG